MKHYLLQALTNQKVTFTSMKLRHESLFITGN